ncbi:phosphotyrosine protein phosphatase [Colletotrichum tofieldiae]|nr:phosphotyrosine protein phosphatase [Colletotrichum tofieldiae]
MTEQPVSVLFVCLGNICRSTMAEGVFRNIAQKPPYKGLISKVDSCGTDSRTMATLEDHGITDYHHAGRKVQLSSRTPRALRTRPWRRHATAADANCLDKQVSPSDFNKFDYIFAMDRSNLRDLQNLQQRGNPDSKAKVMLFGEFSGGRRPEVVDDPYYGGDEGFSKAYEQCTRFSGNFLKHVFPNIDPKA